MEHDMANDKQTAPPERPISLLVVSALAAIAVLGAMAYTYLVKSGVDVQAAQPLMNFGCIALGSLGTFLTFSRPIPPNGEQPAAPSPFEPESGQPVPGATFTVGEPTEVQA